MIKVNRLNRKELVINSDLILFVDCTPDTVISFTNGSKMVVLESLDEIIEKVIEYKSSINSFKSIEIRKEV